MIFHNEMGHGVYLLQFAFRLTPRYDLFKDLLFFRYLVRRKQKDAQSWKTSITPTIQLVLLYRLA